MPSRRVCVWANIHWRYRIYASSYILVPYGSHACTLQIWLCSNNSLFSTLNFFSINPVRHIASIRLAYPGFYRAKHCAHTRLRCIHVMRERQNNMHVNDSGISCGCRYSCCWRRRRLWSVGINRMFCARGVGLRQHIKPYGIRVAEWGVERSFRNGKWMIGVSGAKCAVHNNTQN